MDLIQPSVAVHRPWHRAVAGVVSLKMNSADIVSGRYSTSISVSQGQLVPPLAARETAELAGNPAALCHILDLPAGKVCQIMDSRLLMHLQEANGVCRLA